MFAPHHQAAADDLVRVCRPGGTIGLLSWTPEGMLGAHGRPDEFDDALDRFCDEWNRGTEDRARFEMQYLLAVGTRVRDA